MNPSNSDHPRPTRSPLRSFFVGLALSMPLALGAFSAPEALAGFEKTITWDPAKCKKPAGGCYRFLTLAPPTQSQIASYHAQCIDVVWTSSSGQTSFWPAGCAGAQGQDIGL